MKPHDLEIVGTNIEVRATIFHALHMNKEDFLKHLETELDWLRRDAIIFWEEGRVKNG